MDFHFNWGQNGVKVSISAGVRTSSKLILQEKMAGAKGFEPSTSRSRNRVAKILKALFGVVYETKRADFPLSVVPKL